MPTTDKETKIVKGSSKTSGAADNGASKVQIKAVDPSVISAQSKKKPAAQAASKPKTETTAKTMTPPMGKPMPKSSAPGRPVPMGKPMPKNAVPMKKVDVPQKPAADPEAEKKPVETVQTKEAPKTVQPPKYEDKTSSFGLKIVKKAEDVKAEEKQAKEAQAAKAAAKKAESVKEEAKPAAPKAAETKAAEPKKPAEPKAEAPKKEAPKPYKDRSEYVSDIGVKVVRRAADEPKEVKKPVEPKRGQKNDNRKPKEFVGNKDNNNRGEAPRKKSTGTQSGKGDKVLAYQAPSGGSQNGRNPRKDKKKDKDKHDRFDFMPTDLSKVEKKKHSKYKEKVDVVDQEELELEALPTGSVVINVPITLAGFCEQIEKSTSEAIMALMKMGIMANINQNLDEETAVLLGMELNVNVVVKKVEEETVEEGLNLTEDRDSDLLPRPPVITVMGHVDHGKTSLLDAIRNTNVTAGEAGGITQHIGASEVEIKGQKIVFLDTPGHEAFTAMRARGAYITDIAILVVAADDSVKPQTIESISHAKAANVPIIVAMNKMDKPAANPDLVKKDLADNGVLVEDWGGETICVPVSAKTGQGIQTLLEMVLLQAEMLELKANPNRLAQGTVIEARLDKSRGPVATLLVTKGTLQAGQAVVAGTASGRIRVMNNWKGETIKKAGPSRAVEITGLTEVPEAGDEFYAVKDDKTAREIAEKRKEKLRQEVLAKNASVSLEKLFSQLEEGEVKELNLIVKADVQGSVGALEQSLEKLQNENVRVKIIHSGVGTVTEGDVMLAETSNAVIIGFNVRPSAAVSAQADAAGVEIRTYRVIYEIIDDIEAAMKGMLDPVFKEVVLGSVEVRDTFKVPNVGIIAGAYVTNGKVVRNASVRLVRDGIVIHEGSISSLKRFKDDAREVLAGFECGIGIEKFNDIKVGDVIECYEMQEVERS